MKKTLLLLLKGQFKFEPEESTDTYTLIKLGTLDLIVLIIILIIIIFFLWKIVKMIKKRMKGKGIPFN